jgi:uncharacterized protein YbcI
VETIDVWITESWDTPGVNSSAALMLQLAYVLHSNKQWLHRTRIRLIKACASSNPITMHHERLRLGKTAAALRVDEFVDEMLVITTTSSIISAESSLLRGSISQSHYFDDTKTIVELNQALQRNATNTAQLILLLPDPRTHAGDGENAAQSYTEKLDLLTNNLPSTMLIFSDDEVADVISTSI